jgi:hypothetical protein
LPTSDNNIGTPGSAGQLATAKEPSTAGTATTAEMPVTAEIKAIAGTPKKSREPRKS